MKLPGLKDISKEVKGVTADLEKLMKRFIELQEESLAEQKKVRKILEHAHDYKVEDEENKSQENTD